METPSPPAQVIKVIFLVSIAVAMLFPILYVVAVSFSSAKDAIAGGLILWPKNPSLEAYQAIARGGIVAHALGVSVGLVLIGTTVKMIATVALAFGLSKRGVPGSKFILVLVLATLLFRPGLIPSYLLVKNLGLIDTYQSLILPGLIGAFYLVILRNFFMNIPLELIEAARLDGASEFQILWQVVAPLARPARRGANFGRILRQSQAAYILLSPFLLLFILVLAYPLMYSLYLSFFDATLNREPSFVGGGNFLRLFTDAEFLNAVGNTAYFSVFTVVGEAVLPLFMAIAMNEHLPFRTLLRTAYFLPVVTSWVVVSLIWSMLFGQQGLANSFVQAVGFSAQPFFSDATQAKWIIIAVSVWKNLGYYMVIYLAALQGVPQELYDAAAVDGATKWRQTWHVAIPALRPVIYFVVTIATIRSMQLFEQPFIMTNGGPLNATLSIVQLLYRHAFVNLEFGYGSAIATFLLVVLVAVALVNRRVHDLIVQ